MPENPGFRSFTQDGHGAALTALNAYARRYRRDERIYSEGETVRSASFARAASPSSASTIWGDRRILAHSREVQTYALVGRPLMIDVVANEDREILFLLLISGHRKLELSERSLHTASKSSRGRVHPISQESF